MNAFAYIVAGFCALWFVQAAVILRNLSHIADVAKLDPPAPERWPSVSVVMAARNEGAGIARSLASRLGDGYPSLEVVPVDDRSEDDTPGIIAEYAARDPRVRPVRLDELPDGWLGKVHALARGSEAATGEWLLFSDADVEVMPGILGKAVAHCEANGFDLLALVPEFVSESVVVNWLWAIFIRVMAMAADPAAVRDPHSKLGVGSGGFTLVRRSALDATPGFEHLRLDTADDMSLGMMVKAAGGRCEFVNGRGAARVPLYESLSAFMSGVEKNGSTLAKTPFPALVAVFALLGCVELSPIVAIVAGLAGRLNWLVALGALTAIVATAATVAPLHRNTGTFAPALMWPVGWVLMAAGVLRSAWLVHRRGGVIWRGTFYSKADVLEAQRFRIG